MRNSPTGPLPEQFAINQMHAKNGRTGFAELRAAALCSAEWPFKFSTFKSKPQEMEKNPLESKSSLKSIKQMKAQL